MSGNVVTRLDWMICQISYLFLGILLMSSTESPSAESRKEHSCDIVITV